MKKKWIAATALSAVLMLGNTVSAEAAQQVQVTLPSFDVELNGTVIDNDTRQYPLLVYKDITYVPMTYYDSRFLGLYTEWNQDTGLHVHTYDGFGAYHIDTTGTKNKKLNTAQIAEGQITVNGQWIDNAKEEYPLLLFRDVTYFPLTWRFAVEEFGWQYQFDNETGLVIDADNLQSENVLLNDGYKDKYHNFDFAINENALYYQGKEGEVYQRPLANIIDETQRKTIAQIPYEDTYMIGYPQVSLYEENDDVYYRYHSGGATMGGNYLYRIADGTTPELIVKRNYDNYTAFDGFGIRTFGPAVGSAGMGMMYIAEDGTMKHLGPESYQYATQADAYDKKRNVLYVTARQFNNETNRLGQASLYEMNLADGEMIKLSDSANENYDVTENEIYYQALQKLFMLDLTTKEEKTIASSSDFVYLYAAADNGVFYACAENQNRLQFWNKHNEQITGINTTAAVTQLYSQNDYVIAHFEEIPDNLHRLLVFDSNGNQLFSTMDVADKVVINKNGVMVYRLAGTSQLVKVQLQ